MHEFLEKTVSNYIQFERSLKESKKYHKRKIREAIDALEKINNGEMCPHCGSESRDSRSCQNDE